MNDDTSIRMIRERLEREKDNYLDLLESLREHFARFARSDRGKGRVYRIYSRGEKQNGNEFKDEWKIFQKLARGIKLMEVNDIIGLTIVCPFVSDMEEVLKFVEESDAAGEFTKFAMVEHGDSRTAYEAKHYTFSLDRLLEISCEVQIKTVLHEAWATKTHDLTYKPGGTHDPRFTHQMDALAAMLSALEKQSELIRQMVEESWHFDEDRRRLARQEIIRKLSDSLNEASKDEHGAALVALQCKVQEQRSHLVSCRIDDPEFEAIRVEVQRVGRCYEFDRDLCRIVAAIVVSREYADCLSWLRNCIDSWKEASSQELLASAYHFEALILYCFGELELAISRGEEALKLRRPHVRPEDAGATQALASVLAGLAYYYAELAGTPAAERLSAERRACVLINEATKLAPNMPQFVDTEGYVEIVFGNSEEKIEAGLQKCEKSWRALREHPLADVSDLFFKIHKRRAYRRLLDISGTAKNRMETNT